MIDPALLEDYNRTRVDPAEFNISNWKFDKFCYAPFTSLYFGHEGKVIACCENREHQLGIYPEKTISEIWNGEAAQKLRLHISSGDLWHGCKGCDFDLKSKNFGGVHARIFDPARLQQRDARYPAMMEFELENTCNLECVMCTGVFSSSIRKNRENLPPIPTPYSHEFVSQLEEFIPHLVLANFFGGEPFLVNIYYDVWEKMAELNPKINVWVITNGTILNNRVKELLNRIRFNLTISIDSIKKETYEKIRVNSGFDRVMQHLQYFRDYTREINSGLTINTCPMPMNWRELPDIVRWANNSGVHLKIIPVRHPEKMSLRALPANELAEIFDFYNSAQITATDIHELNNKKQFEDYIGFIGQWLRVKEKTAAATLQPLSGNEAQMENIFQKISSYLDFSSASKEYKMRQLDLMRNKLEDFHSRLEKAHSFLGEAVLTIANESPVESLIFALRNFSIDELMMKSREKLIDEIDHFTAGHSIIITHFQRLRIYLSLLQFYNEQNIEACTRAFEWWQSAYQRLKKNNELLAEALIRALNMKKISALHDILFRYKWMTFNAEISDEVERQINMIFTERKKDSLEDNLLKLQCYHDFLYLNKENNIIPDEKNLQRLKNLTAALKKKDERSAAYFLKLAGATPVGEFEKSLSQDNFDEDILCSLKSLSLFYEVCSEVWEISSLPGTFHEFERAMTLVLCNIFQRRSFHEDLPGNYSSQFALFSKFFDSKNQNENGHEDIYLKIEMYFTLLEYYFKISSDVKQQRINFIRSFENDLKKIFLFPLEIWFEALKKMPVKELAESSPESFRQMLWPDILKGINRINLNHGGDTREHFLQKLKVYCDTVPLFGKSAPTHSEILKKYERIEEMLTSGYPEKIKFLADAAYHAEIAGLANSLLNRNENENMKDALILIESEFQNQS